LKWKNLEISEIVSPDPSGRPILICTEFAHERHPRKWRDRLDTPAFRTFVFENSLELRFVEISLDFESEPARALFDAIENQLSSRKHLISNNSSVVTDPSFIPIEMFVLMNKGKPVVSLDAKTATPQDISDALRKASRENKGVNDGLEPSQ